MVAALGLLLKTEGSPLEGSGGYSVPEQPSGTSTDSTGGPPGSVGRSRQVRIDICHTLG